jgi:HK97 family phage portal protein
LNAGDFFQRAFGKNQKITLKMQIEEEITEVFFKELATACAVNMIASTIAKCEIRTFIKNEQQKKEEYFLWNYEPNQNENSSDMIQKFITNLCYDNEALIVEVNGRLYVADYFSRRQYALYDDVFSNIVIGDMTLQKTFTSSEVIYMQLNNIDVKQRLEGSYTSYGQTIAKSIRNLIRSHGQKGILDIDAQTSAQKDFTEKLQTLMDDRFKPFFEASKSRSSVDFWL